MKPASTYHEILLSTSSSLINRQLAEKEENGNTKPYSAIEELEKACWNGMLHGMFPEIFGGNYTRCESFLWHTLAGKNFLYINMGPNPFMTEHATSIDPYFYLMSTSEN